MLQQIRRLFVRERVRHPTTWSQMAMDCKVAGPRFLKDRIVATSRSEWMEDVVHSLTLVATKKAGLTLLLRPLLNVLRLWKPPLRLYRRREHRNGLWRRLR